MPEELLPARLFAVQFAAPAVEVDDTSDMKQVLERAVSIIPEGHKGALLTAVTLEGIQLVVAHKVTDNWKFGVVAEKPWKGNASVSAVMMYSW